MRTLLALCLVLLASGCASTGETNPRDPWEGFNRPVYAFNDAVDKAVLKPVAQGYKAVVPKPARTGVTNFFGNLDDIGTALNNFLQGKASQGASDVGRFAVNSIFGILGLWDVATPMGLEKHNEDFGQTLGWWGVPSGPYLMIPLLGPSTARDAPARIVDPQYLQGRYLDNEAAMWILTGTNIINLRANLLDAEKVLDDAALDKYSFLRDAWLQRRQNAVYDGKPPKRKDDDF
ncbi:ABC transporter [Betaproteobacteria bacterium GR16-43]|nr:ABC transporter [Betaproteobacteria bacterium GR16-43]